MQNQHKKININFQPKNITKKLLKDLKDRSRYVIVKRYGLEDPEKRTLESIGKEYGITRERVRQIENFGISSIRKSDAFAEAEIVFKELKDAIDSLGSLVEKNELLSMFGEDSIIQNHIQFFLVLGHEFNFHKEDKEFNERWSTNKDSAEAVHTILGDLHEKIGEDDILHEDEIIDAFKKHDRTLDLSKHGQDKDAIMRFIRTSAALGKNPLGDWGLATSPSIKIRGVRDYAFLVMRKNGSLMHFREVADSIEKTFNRKTHVATTHNELIKDKRFVLVGRGIYGLIEWGYNEGVVRDVISEIIKREGPMTRDEIVDKVLKERYLKRNTILVNLQNPDAFYKDDRGLYHIKEQVKTKTISKKK